MGRRTTIKMGTEDVGAEELDFETADERWNEYRCADGTLVRVKVVVSKIVRLDKKDQFGAPVFLVMSSNVVAASAPLKPKE